MIVAGTAVKMISSQFPRQVSLTERGKLTTKGGTKQSKHIDQFLEVKLLIMIYREVTFVSVMKRKKLNYAYIIHIFLVSYK